MSTGSELVPQNQNIAIYTGERFELEQRMAKLFAMSGLFADIKGTTQEMAIAQAYVKIAMGSSMGFTPAESCAGIDIIQGRPSVGSQLRAARMQRAGYSWRIDKLDNDGCELTIFAGDKELGKSSFGAEDAKAGGLLNKDNYKKDPSSMYFARAITRAQRRYAPGVLSLDVMSSEEAIDYPEPASMAIAAATDTKTEELADKLKAKRKSEVKETPAAAVVSTPPVQPVTQDPAAPAPANATTNPWPDRVSATFLMALGAEKFLEVLTKVLGGPSLAAITSENYKKVWEAMTAAKVGIDVPTGPPNTITSPDTAPDVKDGNLF